MATRIERRLSPRTKILNYVNAHPEGLDRGQVALALGITYWSARHHLERLAAEGLVEKAVLYTVKGYVRRVIYYPIKVVIPGLSRAKIRLYNIFRQPSPEGVFQGWYDVDVVVDVFGMIDIEWWLTLKEVEAAKRHFVRYWKGEPFAEQEMITAWLQDVRGIPFREKKTEFEVHVKRSPSTYLKIGGMPTEYIERAGNLTFREVILGESGVTPEKLEKVGGVFFEKAMIILDGEIKWFDARGYQVWSLKEEDIKKLKEEEGK